ncbi:MAG: 23S rRNA (pseudouridine(1915)-N(3))-methyltransferase RlmH [Filomicrobium sp.]
MRLTIAAIGRLKSGPEAALVERYTDLAKGLGRSCSLGPVQILEFPEARTPQRDQRRNDEAKRLLSATKDASVHVLLDERGNQFSSDDLASFLSRSRDDGAREIAFLIGGADGHGEPARKACPTTLSLSKLTLPHGLARIMLAEQLYRAITIVAGHPYHRA